MSWTATERFGARAVPGGLALAQDLVNTHATERGGVDLLAERTSAENWVRSATEQWTQARGQTAPAWAASAFGRAGLRALVEVRTDLTGLLEPIGRPGPELQVGAQVQVASDVNGCLSLVPTGTGVRWLRSAVWSEVLLGQQEGTWSRLKLCREPGCRTAFYDSSRNGSGVWHNVATCGNLHNLRASRNRRKPASVDES